MTKQYGILVDLKRCIGCHTCTMACRMENNIQVGSWIGVETVGGPHADTAKGTYPNVSMYFVPKMCNHCRHPPCLPTCPTSAIHKREDGIVLVDKQKCNGCGLCAKACPYEIPRVNREAVVVEMCTLCSHRIDKELEPFCVTCCITRAFEFGDVSDPDSKISQSIRKKRAYVLFPERGTEPSVYYSQP